MWGNLPSYFIQFGAVTYYDYQTVTSDFGLNQGALSSVYAQRQGYKFQTGHVIIGNNINKIKIGLRKVLSPTGTLTVTIRNTSDTILASDTIDVSTLTSSNILYTFNVASTTIQNDYYILAEYSGGDSTNYVAVGGDSGTQPANTLATEYYSAAYNDYSTATRNLLYAVIGFNI